MRLQFMMLMYYVIDSQSGCQAEEMRVLDGPDSA